MLSLFGGQLGFNIRGGQEHSCGIYISKVCVSPFHRVPTVMNDERSWKVMENENWFSRPWKVMETRQIGESHGKVMEFEISLKPESLFHIILSCSVTGRQLWQFEISLKPESLFHIILSCSVTGRQLWDIYFFLVHLYMYIYYFYFKMVMKFVNFGHENSWNF